MASCTSTAPPPRACRQWRTRFSSAVLLRPSAVATSDLPGPIEQRFCLALCVLPPVPSWPPSPSPRSLVSLSSLSLSSSSLSTAPPSFSLSSPFPSAPSLSSLPSSWPLFASLPPCPPLPPPPSPSPRSSLCLSVPLPRLFRVLLHLAVSAFPVISGRCPLLGESFVVAGSAPSPFRSWCGDFPPPSFPSSPRAWVAGVEVAPAPGFRRGWGCLLGCGTQTSNRCPWHSRGSGPVQLCARPAS